VPTHPGLNPGIRACLGAYRYQQVLFYFTVESSRPSPGHFRELSLTRVQSGGVQDAPDHQSLGQHVAIEPVLVFERLCPGSRMSCRDAGRPSAAPHSVVNPAGPSTTRWQLWADHHLNRAAEQRDEIAPIQ